MRYLIIKENTLGDENMRLCNDSRWRGFALLGDYGSCVRVYSLMGYAQRRAKRIGGVVACIPATHTMDACGRIFDEENKLVPMQDFIK